MNENQEHLEHGKLGEAMKNHLYSARKWVNGKWRYTYDTINNALGADERVRRDSTAIRSKQAHDYTNKKHESYLNQKHRYVGDKGYREWREAYVREKATQKRAEDAQAAYDKTLYGAVDKAKQKLSETASTIGASINKGKNTVSEKINLGKSKIYNMFNLMSKRRKNKKLTEVSSKSGKETYSKN